MYWYIRHAKTRVGPDICGPGTKKVHAIFNYKDKNLLIKRDVTCKVGKLNALQCCRV